MGLMGLMGPIRLIGLISPISSISEIWENVCASPNGDLPPAIQPSVHPETGVGDPGLFAESGDQRLLRLTTVYGPAGQFAWLRRDRSHETQPRTWDARRFQ